MTTRSGSEDGSGRTGSSSTFAGLEPGGCGEGRLLRARWVFRHLLGLAGRRQPRGEPQSRRPRQNPADRTARLCSQPSCGADTPRPLHATPVPGSAPSAGAEGPRPRDAQTPWGRAPRRCSHPACSATRPVRWACARCWLTPHSRGISFTSVIIRITNVSHQCLRLATTTPQRPIKPATPSELPGGLQSKQHLPGVSSSLSPGCGRVPCPWLPCSRLTPRRGNRGTGGGGGPAEGQGTGAV